MTSSTRRFGGPFDPAEIREPHETSVVELAAALGMARDLEALSTDHGIRPTDSFTDRVMNAVATAPAPRPAIGKSRPTPAAWLFGLPLAVRHAWRVAANERRPAAARFAAFAFVVLVAVAAVSVSTVAVVTVGGLLGRDTSPPPSVAPAPAVLPLATPTPSAPPPIEIVPQPSPLPTGLDPVPSETPPATEPSGRPVTATPPPREQPDATATPTARQTARPTRTPRATETAEPTETPEPTDDNSGPGGGGRDNSGPGGGGGDDGGGSGGSGPG